MKKEFLPIALSLVMIASCAQEEVDIISPVQSSSSSETISLMMNTSRAAIFDITDMQGSTSGFDVYTTSTTTEDGDTWFLDGSNSYLYSSTLSTWGWSGEDEAWPTDETTYPLTFMAIFSTDLTGVTLDSVTAGDAVTDTDDPLSAEVTIQEPTSQTDILATVSSVSSKPADGVLSLTFSHILSKIDFGVIVGYQKRAFVNTLALNNVDSVGTYSFKNQVWTSNGSTTDTFSATYDVSSALSDFSTGITGTDTAESTATALTNTDGEYSLMLLPQTTTATDVDTWSDGTTPTGVYVEMLYRAEYYTDDLTYSDYIGYEDAENHPNYSSSTDSAYSGEPLFIKVGFPLSAAWSLKNGYTYNIKLATADATNGYLLDDVYYDSNGDPTSFGVDADFDIEIGDPVSGGYINFSITVEEWGDSTSSTLN